MRGSSPRSTHGRAERACGPRVQCLTPCFAVLLVLVLLVACTADDDDAGAVGRSTATAAPTVTGAAPAGTSTATGTPSKGGDGEAVEYRYGLGPAGHPRPGATEPAAGGSAEQYMLQANIGEEAPQDLIDEWNIDVTADGEGLPDAHGDVQSGADVYAASCARCHGADGFGTELAPRLVLGDEGEPGPWEYGAPRTVANYWQYLTTYIDYIRRAMPMDDPTSLSDQDTYSVVAWILNQNDMLEDDAVLDPDTVMQVNELPNFESFFRCYPDECRPESELQDGGQ